ncbi:hypothetical protein [Paraburkholderia sprentiae]|nr:hypothetical protein [Paraburkholderia sprentiae]
MSDTLAAMNASSNEALTASITNGKGGRLFYSSGAIKNMQQK